MEPTFWQEVACDTLVRVTLIQEREGRRSDIRVGIFKPLATHARTRQAILRECVLWPAIELASARASGTRQTDEPSSSSIGSQHSMKMQDRAKLLIKYILRLATRAIDRTFLAQDWNVGIVAGQPQQFLSQDFRPDVRWLDKPVGASLADPFVVRASADHATLFCERWASDGGRGRIVRAVVSPETTHITDEFSETRHVSYPFVFHVDGRAYALPERHQSRELVLYEIGQFGWRREAILLSDFAAVDATIFPYGNRFWIFTGDEDRDSQTNLFAFHAEKLHGPWIAHELNPIKTDVTSSRGAGCTFLQDGVTVRPAQDCSKTYGGAIVFNQIFQLTATDFEERPIGRFGCERFDVPVAACHTISYADGVCAIDARRDHFDPLLPLRRLLRRIGSDVLPARRSSWDANTQPSINSSLDGHR